MYYLFAGFVADLALATNIIILVGAMCSIAGVLFEPPQFWPRLLSSSSDSAA